MGRGRPRRRFRTAALAAHEAKIALTGVADVIVTESEGSDGARLIIIDTSGEPDGSDGSRPIRVLVNDSPVYEGVPYAGQPADPDNG